MLSLTVARSTLDCCFESDLRGQFGMNSGIFHTSMTKNLQPLAVLVIPQNNATRS